MHIANQVLLALTLFLCGGYAGMTLFCQIGVLPAMRRLEPRAYVSTWAILDGLMERAMPPYKLSLLAINLASAVCLHMQHHTQLAIATGISFVLSVVALVLTIAVQVPLNKRISSYPTVGEQRELLTLRSRTEHNFTIRFVLAIVAFAVLCGAAVLFPL